MLRSAASLPTSEKPIGEPSAQRSEKVATGPGEVQRLTINAKLEEEKGNIKSIPCVFELMVDSKCLP